MTEWREEIFDSEEEAHADIIEVMGDITITVLAEGKVRMSGCWKSAGEADEKRKA